MHAGRFARLPVTLARVVVTVEATQLLLWLVAPGLLRTVLLEAPTRPPTVVSFLLLGATLGFRLPRFARAAALGTVALLAVRGVLTATFGHPLVPASTVLHGWPGGAPVGPMALSSALVLLGLTAATAVSSRRPRTATALACAAFGVTFVSLVGLVLGARTLSSWQTATSMAWPTVPAALACAVAVLLERPQLPAARAVRASGTPGALVRGSLAWAFVVPLAMGWSVQRAVASGEFDPAYGLGLMVTLVTVGAVGAIALGAGLAGRADRDRAAAADRERLRYLLDGTPVGIFETDADGRRRYTNARWHELTGHLTEPDGSWVDALHPGDRARVAAEWRAAVGAGLEYTGRFRFLRPDGSVIWVDTTAVALRNEHGAVARWLGSVTDVTEQVEAGARLEQSELRYRSVVDTMAEGVVLQGPDGAVLTVNDAAAAMLGRAVPELLRPGSGDPLRGAVHEDGFELAPDELPAVRVLAGGRPVRGAVMGLRRPDGTLVWLQVNSQPTAAAGSGSPERGALTTLTDVTEARVAARSLARSEEKFRLAMAHAPIGMALVDLDGRFVDVNRALCRLVGYTERELLGHSFQQITHPDDLDADLGNLARLRSGAVDHYTMEKRYLTRDGDVVWVLLAVSMTRDEDDQPSGFIAQVQDISAAREAQERLQHQALHDPLTGLANRDLLMDRLGQALARSARSGTPVAVLFCDLDGFKEVNDTLGHEAGDAVLVGVADRLRAAVRPGDTVARLGGDEFVVVAEGVPGPAQQRALAERVRSAVAQPIPVADQVLAAAVSVGLAVGGPGDDARAILRQADASMYRAKARGRAAARESAGKALEPT